MKKEDCIFCKIAAGEIPSRTIYEDETFRVILDIEPATKGHALIIPKNHYKDLYELGEKEVAEVFPLAQKLALRMTERLHCDGFNIIQNNGEAANQTVPHFHLHLIPRYVDDVNREKLVWAHTEMTSEEMDEVLEQLK